MLCAFAVKNAKKLILWSLNRRPYQVTVTLQSSSGECPGWGTQREKTLEIISFPFVSPACFAVVAAAGKGGIHGGLRKGLPIDVGIFSRQPIFGYLIGPM